VGSRSGLERFVASEGGTGTNEDFVLSQLNAWLSRQYAGPTAQSVLLKWPLTCRWNDDKNSRKRHDLRVPRLEVA
jgi:hypothetical protein